MVQVEPDKSADCNNNNNDPDEFYFDFRILIIVENGCIFKKGHF